MNLAMVFLIKIWLLKYHHVFVVVVKYGGDGDGRRLLVVLTTFRMWVSRCFGSQQRKIGTSWQVLSNLNCHLYKEVENVWHFWLQFFMTIFDDHFWWPFLMTILDDNSCDLTLETLIKLLTIENNNINNYFVTFE